MADRIELVEQDGGTVVLLDGRPQSHVDLDDPGRLVFDYVRRIGDVLDALAPDGVPLRVVHVGGAGLTLPRYLARTRPRSSQVVLEPDEELTALVRAELPLPPRSGIKVRPVDGRSGLAALPPGRADAVVVDAYDDGRVPRDLVTREAFAALAAALAPHGVAVLNISDAAPFPLVRDVVAGLEEVLPVLAVCSEPATAKGRRAGNVLVLATRSELPVAALRARARGSATPYRVLDGGAVRDGFGGGTALDQPSRGGG